MKFPKFLNFSRTAKVQKTPVQIEQDYKQLEDKIQLKINDQSNQNVLAADKLSDISETLWETREYSEKERRFWKRLWHFVKMAAVGYAEVPINRMGLEIYNQTKTTTTLMALAVGVVSALLAEAIGYCLKRFVVEKKAYWVIFGIILSGFVIAGFWQLAGFRVQYRLDMGYKKGISQMSQILIALFFFCLGVWESFNHTSSVKNLKLEKTFYSKLAELIKARKNLDDLSDEKAGLNDKKAEAIQSYEKWFADEEKRKADDAILADLKAKKATTNPTSSVVTHTQGSTTVDHAVKLQEDQTKFDSHIKNADRIYNEMVGLIKHVTDPKDKVILMNEVAFQTKKSEANLALSKAEGLLSTGVKDSGEITRIKDALTKLTTV